MEKRMSLKTGITKKGSYVVEAAITLPIFMIAVIVLISIIMFYANIEDANFILANEMRREALQSAFFDGGMLFPARVSRKICENCEYVEDLTITDYLYKEDHFQIDQVIYLECDMKLNVRNPLDLLSRASYELSLMTRAYVGKYRDLDPMSAAELSGDDSEPVYVFPHLGKKYHGKSCTYVRASYTSGPLTGSVKKKYAPCSICHSKGTPAGTTVYYFPEYGDAYHLKGCKALARDYIEMEKKTARERGYSPCSKCGGN